MHSHISAAPKEEHQACIGFAVTNGLSPGAKLREQQMLDLGELGVEFRGEMPLEQWRTSARALAMMKGAFHYWLADFIGYGYAHYDQQLVEQTLIELGFSQFDVDRALAIHHTPRGLRTSKLTSEHYYVLSKAQLDIASLTYWASEAVDNKLTAVELESSIAAGEVVKALSGGGGSHSRGLATIEGFRQLFEGWWKRVDQTDPVAKWDRQRKAEVFEELRPSTILGIRLARELNIELEEAK